MMSSQKCGRAFLPLFTAFAFMNPAYAGEKEKGGAAPRLRESIHVVLSASLFEVDDSFRQKLKGGWRSREDWDKLERLFLDGKADLQAAGLFERLKKQKLIAEGKVDLPLGAAGEVLR